MFDAVKLLARKVSVNDMSIELVALDLMALDTMDQKDHMNMVTREDAAFLFLLKGFADIDDASTFLSNFMDTLDDDE